MTLFVVRHVKAGDRSSWTGSDRDRPISKSGRRQANALAARLVGEDVSALISSPWLRCVQSLQPLGEMVGLKVEEEERLGEGASVEESLAVARDAPERAVLCSHGDVIPELIAALVRRGMELTNEPDWRKATLWILDGAEDGGSRSGGEVEFKTATVERPPRRAHRSRRRQRRSGGAASFTGPAPTRQQLRSATSRRARGPIQRGDERVHECPYLAGRIEGEARLGLHLRRFGVVVDLGRHDRHEAMRIGILRRGLDRRAEVLPRPLDELRLLLLRCAPGHQEDQPPPVRQRLGVIRSGVEHLPVQLDGAPWITERHPRLRQELGDVPSAPVPCDLVPRQPLTGRSGDQPAGERRHTHDRGNNDEASGPCATWPRGRLGPPRLDPAKDIGGPLRVAVTKRDVVVLVDVARRSLRFEVLKRPEQERAFRLELGYSVDVNRHRYPGSRAPRRRWPARRRWGPTRRRPRAANAGTRQ